MCFQALKAIGMRGNIAHRVIDKMTDIWGGKKVESGTLGELVTSKPNPAEVAAAQFPLDLV